MLHQHEALATSTPFPLQEMIVKPHNWVNILNKTHSSQGDKYSDISTISYFSDGRTLNATLWLASFNPTPTRDKIVNYGMLIDADSNKNTGIGGIDYNVEIAWNSTTNTWNKVVEQYSATGGKRTLSDIHNYKDFFRIGERYVLLSSDVTSLGFSNHYKVLFYAGQLRNYSTWIVDFSNWANIPPPEVVLSTLQRSIYLTPGEEKSIELQINSTANMPSIVVLSLNRTSNMDLDIQPNPVYISPLSSAFSLITIKAGMNPMPAPYIIPIFANVTFPEKSIRSAYGSLIDVPQQNIASQFTLTAYILPPSPSSTLLARSVNTIQYTIAPQTLAALAGLVVTPVVGWLVPRVLDTLAARRKIRNLSVYVNEINSLHDTHHQNKDTYLENLERLMRKIEDNYAQGNINESQFGILKDKISEYRKETTK
jgi:hypothetical protein